MAHCYTAPPRHLLAILACIGLTLGFCMRQVLPITIQEMTVPFARRGPRLHTDYGHKHNWTQDQQALTLMGFYMGYSVSHFLVGPVIGRMGARGPLIVGMAGSAVMTALMPLACDIGWSMAMVIRILTGVGQSALLPGISSLLTYWVPLESRATIAAIIYTGAPLGTFIGIYLSAIAVAYWQNWCGAYYMWSAFTSVWLAFFMAYVYSYPKSHPRIAAQGSSYQRADFIEGETIQLRMAKLSYGCQTFATFGHTYIVFTLDTYLPKYLNEALDLELEDYSIYAGTPFVTMYLCGIISRAAFNWLVKVRNVSADFLRLIYCSLCNVLCGAVLVAALHAASQGGALALMHAATFLAGFFYGGLNMLDMSLRRSHVAMAIVNGIATTSGVLAIAVIALSVKSGADSEWRFVSYIMIAVEVFVWVCDGMLTMTKLCLMPAEPDQRWYHNASPAEHRAKLAATKAIKAELTQKQRGEPSSAGADGVSAEQTSEEKAARGQAFEEGEDDEAEGDDD